MYHTTSLRVIVH